MSSLLDEIVSAYLDTLGEREFDAPFIALLRALGFDDIHFLHGPFEFGKDFIAKSSRSGRLEQYTFQTKAGDLNLDAWRGVRAQIDDMRTTAIGHPSFDAALPRRVIVVTTGRLVGQAAVNSEQYKVYVAQHENEVLEVWDKDDLISAFSSSPEVGLADTFDADLLRLFSEIDHGTLSDGTLESASVRWVIPTAPPKRLSRGLLEAAIISNRLRRPDRLDLACITALCATRGLWASVHGQEPPPQDAVALAELARDLFEHYASALFEVCKSAPLDSVDFFHASNEFEALVTYHVRCCRIAELLGLLGLLWRERGNVNAATLRTFIRDFIAHQPGAAHPVSDRWAVSLIPSALVLVEKDRAAVETYLIEATRWTADRYDNGGLGVASPEADARTEVDYLLGSPLEHTPHQRRVESTVAGLVLDLASVLQLSTAYKVARNDFEVVGAVPSLVHVADTMGQYLHGSDDLINELNPPFDPGTSITPGWESAPHHRTNAGALYLDRIGRSWDLLATSLVLRDRHFLHCLRALAQPQH
jgi:hypothetical protein